MFEITSQHPCDITDIDKILDLVFGQARLAKTSYRYRTGVDPIHELSLVARDASGLVGTIRYWPVCIGADDTAALLLGPVAVAPKRHGEGIGKGLIRQSLGLAASIGHRRVLLVGDEEYYGPLGFHPAKDIGILMSDESPDRLMYKGLTDDAFEGVRGPVLPWRWVRQGLTKAA